MHEQANEKIGLKGPVESFQEYITWVANKGYYIDGLQLKAIAEKLQQNIIVFNFRRQENLWQRFLISGKATDKAPDCTSPPICLALKDKHYRALCRPNASTEVPQSWHTNTEEVDRIVFCGQGPKSMSKKSDSQSCRLSLPKSSSSGKSLQLSTKLSLPSPDKSACLSFAPTSEPARSLIGKDNLDLPSPDRSSCKNLDFSPAGSMTKEKKQVFLPQVPPKSGTLPFRIRGKQTIDKEKMQQVKRVLNPEHSSLGSADIPKRKRFRAAKHETFRKTRRIQEVIQLQNSKQNRVCAPAQQGLGGLPVFPSSDLDVPWWTCALCGFQVFRYGSTSHSNPAYVERRKHLKNVHGTTATSLVKGDSFENPHGIKRANEGLAQRWKEKYYALFQERKWNGAHDIGPEPDHWRQYTVKATGIESGLRPCTNVKHVVCVSAADLPSHPCKLAKGPIPSIAKRKEIWKSCNPPVLNRRKRKQSSTQKTETIEKSTGRSSLSKQVQGTAPTSRGLQGVRVGEASHPGPKRSHPLKVWSQNLRSWHSNGAALLSQAEKEDVYIVALQETVLAGLACPTSVIAWVGRWLMSPHPRKIGEGWQFFVGNLVRFLN